MAVDLIYIDESGDHAPSATNPEYPVFVVAACIFDQVRYTRNFVPALLEFKLKHWQHEAIILHEREIRKSTGACTFLFERAVRNVFLSELSELIRSSGANVAAVAWDKRKNSRARSYAECLLRLLASLAQTTSAQGELRTAILESRGLREDREIMAAVETAGITHQWRLFFIPKSRNIPGLQLADLCARPIGLKVLTPEKVNRAFDETISLLFSRNFGLEKSGLIVMD